MQEFENQSSDEGKFVKDLDQFDMILQAYEYEMAEQQPGGLDEFFKSTEGDLSMNRHCRFYKQALKRYFL